MGFMPRFKDASPGRMCRQREPPVLFLEGYRKVIRWQLVPGASPALGSWRIDVTNDRGRTATFVARSWLLRSGPGATIASMPGSDALWTFAAIEALVEDQPTNEAFGALSAVQVADLTAKWREMNQAVTMDFPPGALEAWAERARATHARATHEHAAAPDAKTTEPLP